MRWKALGWTLACALTIGGLAWLSRDVPHANAGASNQSQFVAKDASRSGHDPKSMESPSAWADGHAAHFWSRHHDADLSGLQARAGAGNAVAQRQLGQAYERCFPVLASPADDYLEGVRSMAAHLKTSAERQLLVGAAHFRLQQCQSLDNGQIIPAEAAKLWLDLAAQRGDLPAQAMAAVRSPGAEGSTRVAAAWDRALAAADGRALNALVGSEENAGFTHRLGGIVDPEDAVAVMSIVGCRAGAPCQPGGEVMLDLCLSAFHCSDRGFEDLIWQSGDLGDRELPVGRQVDQVLRAMARLRATN